jgi:hypothetical protein
VTLVVFGFPDYGIICECPFARLWLAAKPYNVTSMTFFTTIVTQCMRLKRLIGLGDPESQKQSQPELVIKKISNTRKLHQIHN